jgi:hypothetical protein
MAAVIFWLLKFNGNAAYMTVGNGPHRCDAYRICKYAWQDHGPCNTVKNENGKKKQIFCGKLKFLRLTWARQNALKEQETQCKYCWLDRRPTE